MEEVQTKIQDLIISLLCSSYDKLILIESWLSDDIADSEIKMSNYKLFKCDRSKNSSDKSRRGGILTTTKEHINIHVINSLYTFVEQLFLLCSIEKEFYYWMCVYSFKFARIIM